jgi:glutamine phosphoribosylpyrophosphate amidotransferase
MDTPDFRTHSWGWKLLAGFEAGLQSESDAFRVAHASLVRHCERSEAIHWRNDKTEWIASSLRSSQ